MLKSVLLVFITCLVVSVHGAGLSEVMDKEGAVDGITVLVGADGVDEAIAQAEKRQGIVHVLLTDPGKIQAARKLIDSKSLSDRVYVGLFNGKTMPYGDNLVNQIVVPHSTSSGQEGSRFKVESREIERVLTPGGVALISSPDNSTTQQLNNYQSLPGRKDWIKYTKPVPAEIDDWPHALYGPDGNAVSHDTMVGPPGRIQWVDGPTWQKHHDLVPSVTAVISGGGRLFYFLDESATGVMKLPGKWSLVARDAFNGFILWNKPIKNWGSEAWSGKEAARFNQPTHISKRFVAAGDRLYVTLGLNAPIAELDAKTGKELRSFPDTARTSEFVISDGVIFAVVTDKAMVPVRGRNVPSIGKKQILALNIKTGRALWRSRPYEGSASKVDTMRTMKDLNLIVGEKNVFIVDASEIIAMNRVTGGERWRVKRPPITGKDTVKFGYSFPGLCMLMYNDGKVFFSQPKVIGKGYQAWNSPVETALWALDAEKGTKLWERKCGTWGHYNETDLFLSGGKLWVHAHDKFVMLGLEPKTGKVLREISTDGALNNLHHHRCYRNRATDKYILTSRRGVEYINLETGENRTHHWVRGICRFGILPANGLLYAPPHPCICYSSVKLNGFYALAPWKKESFSGKTGIIKGVAVKKISAVSSSAKGWTTYRGNNARRGTTSEKISTSLKPAWTFNADAVPSSPVISGDTVLFSIPKRNKVCAVSASTGKLKWTVYTGGAVDTPPTIYGNAALFGCDDGWIRCVTLDKGELVWKFRAAPGERFLLDRGSLASAWPVHGTVLVDKGIGYAVAGRNSFLDGGMWIYKFKPMTGEVLSVKRFNSRDPETGASPSYRKYRYDYPEDDPGGFNDLLLAGDNGIYMRHIRLARNDLSMTYDDVDSEGGAKDRKAARKQAKVPSTPLRLFTMSGILDDAWFNQAFWSIAWNRQTKCQYLVYDDKTCYGLSAFTGSTARHSRNRFSPGKGYRLFAHDLKTNKSRWSVRVPLRVKAMAGAQNALVIAGVRDIVEPKNPWAHMDGKRGAVMQVRDMIGGRVMDEHKLAAAPVFDGMAISGGRVYIALQDGSIRCFGK